MLRSKILASVFAFAIATGLLATPRSALAAEECAAKLDPQWAALREEADNLVRSGEMTQEKAESYKCNPQSVIEDAKKSIEKGEFTIAVTPGKERDPKSEEVIADEEASFEIAKAKTKCLEGIWLTYEVGAPKLLTARQSLNWCYNGSRVSGWSGMCEGTITKWGKATYWSFDSCSQNELIPYMLGGKKDGGIHHKTRINFVNKTPWTYDQSFLLEQWGHNDGSFDQMIDGKFVGVSKGKK